MQDKISLEEYNAWADKNIQKMKEAEASDKWVDDGAIKADTPCRKFKMEIQGRIASKGIAENVEGTIQEFADMLKCEKFSYKLDPQMIEFKKLKVISDDLAVNYMRFKGMGPVQDRDFVLLQKAFFQKEGKKFYLSSCSCAYPEPVKKDVVRAEAIQGGYIAEAIDAKTIRVTYISDGNMKGSIPDFIKNIVSSGQGQIVSKVNALLKEFRESKK